MRNSVCVAILLCSSLLGFGQSSAQLKTKRDRIQQELKLLDQELGKEKQTAASAASQLLEIDNQIKLRQMALERIRLSKDTLKIALARIEADQIAATKSLDVAKQNMRRLIRYRLYFHLQNQSPLLSLLATTQLSTAFLRQRMYDRLAEKISASAKKIAAHATQLSSLRTSHLDILDETVKMEQIDQAQQKILLLEQAERQNLLLQSRKKSESLSAEFAKKQKEYTELEAAIAAMIKAEIAAATAKAKSEPKTAKKPAASTEDIPMTPEVRKLSGDFEKNQGRLPWPVTHGLIVRPYGQQRHPEVPSILIKNTGVDIRTLLGARVSAVFDGEITGVQWVPGFAYTVIVRHGQYFTVYSNMAETNAKKGQKIKAGDSIGTATGKSGHGEMHFEVWKGKSQTDPQSWLAKK